MAEEIAPDALEALSSFDWPGNLRQLENVVQRGMLTATGRAVQLADLPSEVRGVALSRQDPASAGADFGSNEIVPLRELERRAIEHALRVTHGSVSLAAKRLGVGDEIAVKRGRQLQTTRPRASIKALKAQLPTTPSDSDAGRGGAKLPAGSDVLTGRAPCFEPMPPTRPAGHPGWRSDVAPPLRRRPP